MRVQNEGTGKSSWWVLNPDAKPGKSTRRRANTMEGGRYEKKRGRVKKKLEVRIKGFLLVEISRGGPRGSRDTARESRAKIGWQGFLFRIIIIKISQSL